MLEAKGNLWTLAQNSNLVITTNGAVTKAGDCVMGRGIAKEAKDHFPGLSSLLGGYIKQYGNRPFNLGVWRSNTTSYRLLSMPVKDVWFHDADIRIITDSASKLFVMANKFGWDRIWLPRPGCGNGHLDWNDVKPYLDQILDDRFIVVTF